MWFSRNIFRATNPPLRSYILPLNANNGNQIVRKCCTTLWRKHLADIPSRTKLDQSRNCHIYSNETNIQSENIVLNIFSNELNLDLINKQVHVRGIVLSIRDSFLIIKDKTGLMLLTISNKNEWKIWLEQLERFCKIKVIGTVKKSGSKYGDTVNMKFPCHVLIKEVISVLPRNVKKKNKKGIGEKSLDEESCSEMKNSSERGLNFIKCNELRGERIGRIVQIFGWVQSINKHKKFFLLGDGSGCITVFYQAIPDLTPIGESLEIADQIIVEGLLMRLRFTPSERKNKKYATEAIKLSANSIRKLNKMDFAELAAPDLNSYTIRSHNCGELSEAHVGQKVTLFGWVLYIRMKRFIAMHDRFGVIQLVVDRSKQNMNDIVKNLSLESVIAVEGTVTARPMDDVNSGMSSGKIEVFLSDMMVISDAGKLPFYKKDPRPNRSKQLEHRYLDMRQDPTVRCNLEFRSKSLLAVRKYLIERLDFIEVETPTLFRRSLGGAQEFLVPTRKEGEFYALVQSPQQFKQLLMVGGLDRYFQIARCYRDEDADKERQPEFTQLDIEMSFCDQEGIMRLMEDIIKQMWPKDIPEIDFPFPRLTYEEAMKNYGTDKPDIRYNWKIKDFTKAFIDMGPSCTGKFDIEALMKDEDFSALVLVIPNGKDNYSSLKTVADDVSKHLNSKIFFFNARDDENPELQLSSIFSSQTVDLMKSILNFNENNAFYLGFGNRSTNLKAFGELRTIAAKVLERNGVTVYNRINPLQFLWIVDFPLFEEVNGDIKSYHHPFTQPNKDDLNLLNEKTMLQVRGLSYDLVLNGVEIGGGSIRNHDAQMQEKILDILGLDKSYFQHMLDALKFGAPIHGGFALGIDRFFSLIRGSSAILDVIAFPKYSSGRDPLSGAPSDVPLTDKLLYHLN